MKHPYQMIEMTSGIRPLKWPVVVLAIISLFGPMRVGAQTDNGPVSINMNSIAWKTNPEIDQALTSEKERIDVLLSTPDLQQDEQSIYKAYKLMLTYIQQHIHNNVPTEDAIVKGYQQVIHEAPKNDELAKLPDHVLGTYLPGLIEILTAVPAPVPEPR